jgi:hypothetical protein
LQPEQHKLKHLKSKNNYLKYIITNKQIKKIIFFN